MTMGDDLLLLAISPRRGGHGTAKGRVFSALRFAELADLAMAGRITVRPREIRVVEGPEPADRRLKNVLLAIAGAPHPPSLEAWVRDTPPEILDDYLFRLAEQGAVRLDRRHVVGGPDHVRVTLLDHGRRERIRAGVDRVAHAADPGMPSAADRAIAGLVCFCRLDAALYRGPRGWPARRRLRRLAHAPGLPRHPDATPSPGEPAGAAASEFSLGAITMAAASFTPRPPVHYTTPPAHHGHGGGGLGGHGGAVHHGGGHHG